MPNFVPEVVGRDMCRRNGRKIRESSGRMKIEKRKREVLDKEM